MSEECKTSPELLSKSAFPDSGEIPLVYILIAEEASTGNPAGFCLYFKNYSTFTGKPGLYLEDLFVRQCFRGKGLGTAFFDRLKAVCREEDYPRLEWSVLDWNKNARDFYTQKIGAEERAEWIMCRSSGEGLN